MIKTVLAVALLSLGLTAPSAAREITHAMGVTEVPDAPQRIIILTNEGTEALLYLGTVPVGAVQSWDGDPWYDHLADALKDTVPLGTENAVNLEVLASLEPDLIIGNKVRQEKIYEQLSSVAPTVFSEDLSGSWQANFQLYADILGKSAQGAADLAAFADRTTALGSALGPAIDEQISLVRFAPGRTRIYYKDTFAGVILDQIGLKRPPSQDKDAFAEEVQKERIPEMAGDRIFYFSDDADPEETKANLAEWTHDELWNNLPAVKAGKAQRVSELVWNTGGGIYCAFMMLDELAAIYGVTLPPLAR
ncbi:MAG TPA: iron-siderophore ABC transporter substrate-binding protein [Devosia sp.]|nr:iron-siderophore ABC transporter substrate-binding protein [Devosia sp.]